jgi:putative membrane protein
MSSLPSTIGAVYMRFILTVLLVVVFGYSLALVLFNSLPAEVNLIFTKVPAMNLGLLLIITLALGLVGGLLLGIQVFGVFQSRWEIKRLQKELEQLRTRHLQAASNAAAAVPSTTPVIEKTVNIPPAL